MQLEDMTSIDALQVLLHYNLIDKCSVHKW